MGKEGVERQNL